MYMVVVSNPNIVQKLYRHFGPVMSKVWPIINKLCCIGWWHTSVIDSNRRSLHSLLPWATSCYIIVGNDCSQYCLWCLLCCWQAGFITFHPNWGGCSIWLFHELIWRSTVNECNSWIFLSRRKCGQIAINLQ